MKYLITGGNGFLGKHLCRYLDAKNIDYVATVRANPGPKQVATGDLTRFTGWQKLFQDVDTIVHTAAKAHDMSGRPELEKIYLDTNLKFTRDFAAAAKKFKIKRFIFISTIKVNGEFSGDKPFTAGDQPNPTDSYGKSKYLAELELMKLHETGLFEVIILRPCLIYGSGVKANFENLMAAVRKHLPLPFGLVRNKRSFISADNFSDLIVCCANSSAAAGQIFLASDGFDLSLSDLISLIGRALKIRPIQIPVPVILLKALLAAIGKRDLSVRLLSNLQADITKTKAILNWNPPFKTESEIIKMVTG